MLYTILNSCNSYIFYICGRCDCWRDAIRISIRVKLSPHWNDCLNCSLY